MENERVGIGTAIWRWLSFYNWRKGRRIMDSANRQFTGSAEGIKDAFAIEADDLRGKVRQFFEALSKLELVVEGKRTELKELGERMQALLKRREGALHMIETKNTEHDWEAKFHEIQTEIDQNTARQTELQGLIKEDEVQIKDLERDYMDLQGQLDKLPQQEAQAVATFIRTQTQIDVYERLKGLKRDVEKGPVDAVRDSLRNMEAQASVARRMSGRDSRNVDDELDAAGAQSTSHGVLQQMLAQRAAARAAATGETPVKEGERPAL